jgi:pullulanase/glycogen debranching enzyme
MRSYKFGKVCFGVSLAIMMSLGISYAKILEDDFSILLSSIAQDCYDASKKIYVDGKEVSANIYKDSSAIDKFQRMLVSNVSNASDIDAAIEELKRYGYSVSSKSEKIAFNQGLKLLEERVKFLTHTENPKLATKLDEFDSIRKEFEEIHANRELISFSQSSTASTNRTTTNKNKVKRTNTTKKTAPKATVTVKREVSKAKLGANVADGKTTFAVYAPEATDVKLHLFLNPKDKKGNVEQMKKGADGVWKVTINGELYGTYYGFTADGPKGPGYLFDKTRLLSDPYAYANYNHDGKSIVVDRSYHWLCKNFKRPASKDAVIYEMHVKDFTAHQSSGVKAPYKGKYLGLLQGKGTSKVLGHLKELGVNTIELMPIHEYDNNFAGHPNHWGYMTTHFFAPETAYSSKPYGQAVKELKATIDGLHSEGFAVILDVVFNHTAEGNEQGTPINFKGFDNAGYYRLMPNDKQYYWNGTGCGNEMHTESPMCRRMILDSLKYWMSEYKVDGFRFDLGTIIDKGTMQAIIDELPSNTILTSEPWAADWQRNQWAKADFRNTRLAKWNDDFRENVRGLAGGHVDRNNLMTVLAGSCFWWAAKPAESLNYIEAHDGYTIYDLFKGDKKKVRLAAIALMTAQGIPMIHSGQEFGRSKGGNDNSYDQDNEVNWIDWSVKEKNRDIFNLYKGLIALRMKYPNFRSPVAMNNQTMQWIQPGNNNGLGMYLKGTTDFLVLFNGDSREWIRFNLPQSGTWKVVCDGEKVDDAGLYTAEGDYNVPPTTAIILKK